MSNYEDKYLKYKKKYIDLKNKQTDLEGGNFLSNLFGSPEPIPKSIIFFYDGTNPKVAEVFNKIKTEYKEFLKSFDAPNKPYTIPNDLSEQLNGLLNIFTYTFGNKTADAYFNLKLDNIFINGEGVTSGRMKVLQNPLRKAIMDYRENSKITFGQNTSITRFITCDNLQYQSNKILTYINSNINAETRINSVKNLLNIMKLYQNKTITRIIMNLTDRIGRFDSLNQDIKAPPGMEGTIEHIDDDSKNITEKDQDKNISKKMEEYVQSKKHDFLNDFNLKIEPLTFNKLDSMIYFRKVGKNLEVLNIFEPFDLNIITPDSTDNN